MDIDNSISHNYVTQEDVRKVLKKCSWTDNELVYQKYEVHNASDKMLGFLSDYLKLKIYLVGKVDHNIKQVLSFFIKAISKSNVAKAIMVKEMKLYQKELFFYSVLKTKLEYRDIQPWSGKLVTTLTDAMVFEDLNALQYASRNKFDRFDLPHTMQALNTLARFHASCIIYEENKSKSLGKRYSLNDEYSQFLNEGGYREYDCWFQQCMDGALQAVTTFSKYADNEKIIDLVQERWKDIWVSALNLSNFSTQYRNVICHRDLWNNNILFRYKEVQGHKTPVDCVMVDFQAVRCQPPTGDVMLLLYCNLNPNIREEHMNEFLSYYYKELKTILSNHSIDIEKIMTEREFYDSAELQRKWGLIVCACLLPQFWINDDLTTDIFCDTDQFNDILTKNKGLFIKNMMERNQNYKETVMEIFEEIIERYCIEDNILLNVPETI